ncbi:unnamed protein product [Cyprideis torosa]|uniref:Delta-aminolevulinic acid dehydratase n=1 Tax=Cyprideis torosa TaxID=163714 RepID=A0A7R8WG32_9CRUS|nr:unnamed protein product [Cyprideis torosa]CAG0892483.1 unnamed protein product [Cyprideis torosa]
MLGILAGLTRSDLKIPSSVYEALSIYLLLAIGLKGGVQLAEYATLEMLFDSIVIVVIACLIPLLVFPVLLKLGHFKRADAASIAAHYGSVSVVTFSLAITFLEQLDIPYEGFMIVFLVLLEVPALVIGVLLARYGSGTISWTGLLHEVFFGKSILLLLGGLLIGYLSGPAGMQPMELVFFDMFKGALAIFLLEMGLVAASRVHALRTYGVFLSVFAVLTPILNSCLGIFTAYLLGLSAGGALLLPSLVPLSPVPRIVRCDRAMSSSAIPLSHHLHGGYGHPITRDWQTNTCRITTRDLMYPIFVFTSLEPEIDSSEEDIPSLPGVKRRGLSSTISHLQTLVPLGLKSVLVFPLTDEAKDDRGSPADSSATLRVITQLKKTFPEILVAADLCLCPFAANGHCGITDPDGHVLQRSSVERTAEIALAYARAGADVVAPSGRQDGCVAAIKNKLLDAGLGSRVAVLSYSAKYASCLYGPFRDAVGSAPKSGDRKAYQLPPGSAGLSMRAVAADVEQGADMLMVKPGLAYLDMVHRVKETFPNHPLFVYQVSGEYSMLHHAASNGTFDLDAAVSETLVAFKRAGADVIITYFTPRILKRVAGGGLS